MLLGSFETAPANRSWIMIGVLVMSLGIWVHGGPVVKHGPCVQFQIACLIVMSLADVTPPNHYAIDEAIRDLPGGWRRFIGRRPGGLISPR